MSKPWRATIRMDEITPGGRVRDLAPDADAMKAIARQLDLVELTDLKAHIEITPWYDGSQLDGTWSAHIVQACVVTLDPLPADLSGQFRVRLVPPGSIHAPDPASTAEVDPEADDPPDICEDGEIDLSAYLIEHLALDIDPYPRKPGAEFAPPEPDPESSPFAVLRTLKPKE